MSVAEQDTKLAENVPCPYCGLICDDIEVYRGSELKIKKGCGLSRAKFTSEGDRIEGPMIRRDGELEEASYEEAVELAAEVLREADRPDSYGWSSTSIEAISNGIEVMHRAGGSVNSTASVCHLPSVMGVQDCGAPKATLGQIKNRADEIVYWGSNPVEAHPRHFERVTKRAEGYLVDADDKNITVVDVRETLSARVADDFVKVDPGGDLEVLLALRSLLKGNELGKEEAGGVPVERIEELLDRLKSARFGCLFWGLGLSQSGAKHRNIEALTTLARDLNNYARWVTTPMRGHFNVAGAGQVATWKAGFPGCVDFTEENRVNYAPGENTSVDLLERGGSDAMFVVASDPAAHFPSGAVRRLREIPVVLVDPHRNATTRYADVVIPSAMVGIEAEGTAYRMDGVPFSLKKVVEPPEGVSTDEEIVKDIKEAI